MTLVAVLTCPRPRGASYVEQTIAQVDEALGGSRRLLVSDGPTSLRPTGWDVEVYTRTGRADNKHPGWVAIRAAADAGDGLLFMEDDVLWRSSAILRAAAEHQVAPGAAFTSFFHFARVPGIYPSRVFDMSQALLLPAAAVATLAEFPGNYRGDWSSVMGFDIAVSVCGHHAGWRYELVDGRLDHVGEVSAVRPLATVARFVQPGTSTPRR